MNQEKEQNSEANTSEVSEVDAQVRVLAEKIATELLTVRGVSYKSIECTRAQLMLMKDGKEIDMGGRNKSSIVSVIEEFLKP